MLFLHLPVTPSGNEAQVASKHSSRSKHHAATATASVSGVVHHKVKAGETLYSIANSYKTTVTALQRDNQNVATLRPGMILVVRSAN